MQQEVEEEAPLASAYGAARPGGQPQISVMAPEPLNVISMASTSSVAMDMFSKLLLPPLELMYVFMVLPEE